MTQTNTGYVLRYLSSNVFLVLKVLFRDGVMNGLVS